MQCVVTFEPMTNQGGQYTDGPLDGFGRPVMGITAHPDITDAWDAFQALLESIAATIAAGLTGNGIAAGAVLGAAASWIANELKSGTDKNYGEARHVTIPTGAAYWIPGTQAPLVDWGDDLVVRFRAWSEDEIKAGSANVLPQGAPIVDLLGGFHQTSGTYFYDHSYRIPLRGLPVGVYSVSFTSQDDGWFFDVGVACTLVVEVVPNPYPQQPAAGAIASPAASADTAELSKLLLEMRNLRKLGPGKALKPKHSSPRLDGRAVVPLDTVLKISHDQNVGASPQQVARTTLPL